MTAQERLQNEINVLTVAMRQYPTLLLIGPPSTGMKRVGSAIVQTHSLSPGDGSLILSGNHPDCLIIDGTEADPKEVRESRDRLSSLPSRLGRRYLFLYRADRLHSNATQSLLKLIEEPYPYLTSLVFTDRPEAVLPTIHSRSIPVTIDPPNQEELEEELRQEGIEEPVWRASIAGTFPDVARTLDVKLTKEWHKIWSAALGGSPPSPDFAFLWTEKLEAADESTRVACWTLLQRIAARQASNPLWREIAVTAWDERERSLRAKSNKVRLSTTLVHVYAYAKATSKRRP